MTSFEIKSTLGIAFIYSLRMLGLFIVLPIMSLHLTDLSEYSSTFMIGLAFGMYGLTQALFQIPFGILSDKFGRKKMILIGLFIFLLGSIFIYFSQSLWMIIIGRGLQGAGAISAVLLALLADLTTDSARTKSMAIIGASIGLTFGIYIVLSPILNSYLGFENIFLMIATLTIIAMGVLLKYIPSPINIEKNKENKTPFRQVIFDKVFLKLDLGIFSLHASQIIMFIMIPVMLNNIGYPIKYHWQIYLPVFVISILAIVPMILLSSKKQMLKTFFLGSIILLIYFVGFNFLEATLPSLISKLSPKNLKGLVLGAYNTSQSLGIFMGGVLGGLIASQFGDHAIFIVSGLLLLIWFFAMIKFIFPTNKKDLVLKMNTKFFLQPQDLIDEIYNKINCLEFVEETLIFPSESYIIIKSKNDLILDQKKILKIIGEKNAIS